MGPERQEVVGYYTPDFLGLGLVVVVGISVRQSSGILSTRFILQLFVQKYLNEYGYFLYKFVTYEKGITTVLPMFPN